MTNQSKRMLASASAVAVMVMAWTALSPSAAVVVADEGQAKRLLKAMTDYVGGQKAISFEYDANLEVVTKDKQRLALAASGTVSLIRPNKIRATRSGGFVDIETRLRRKDADAARPQQERLYAESRRQDRSISSSTSCDGSTTGRFPRPTCFSPTPTTV